MTTGCHSIIDFVAITAAGIGPMSIGWTVATLIARFLYFTVPKL
jgi:hypothetical protein